MPTFPGSFGGGDVPVVDITIEADDNNIRKLLKCWLAASQYLEGVLQQLYSERGIDTAEGNQLDVLGRLVGQGRAGLDDDTYRRRIRARITANRSKGNIEEILRVTDLIVFDDAATYVLENQGAAAYVLRVEDIAITLALAEILVGMLRDATSAGVRVIVEYSSLAPSAPWFQWDTVNAGWDQGFFLDAVE